MKDLLPDSSFVPFYPQALAQPVVVWRNERLSPAVDLLQHAYCLPMEGEAASIYDSTRSKCYWGERYGGEGLGSNGGGVRCGLDGTVQVKGVGRNPLAGTRTGFWNTYGGAALEAGLREAIWGEVCHLALPHGGTRVHGLIATGTDIPYKGNEGERRARRVLIVREASLRPAHYMRAVHFAPSEEVRRDYPDEISRTRSAIGLLGRGFAAALGEPVPDAADAATLNHCLETLCRRLAAQMAAAAAKRIVHGSLNASNICLDGGWIDYDKMSTVSDYGKMLTGVQQPLLWSRHGWLAHMLAEWRFFLGKYLPRPIAADLISHEQLDECYHRELERRHRIEFLKLSGIPEAALQQLDPALCEEAFRCFRQITAAGNGEPFRLAPNGYWEMPAKMGHYHLNTVLVLATACHSPAQIDATLQADLADHRLRARFAAAYHRLIESYRALALAQGARSPDEFRLLNSLRANVMFSELYRPTLDARIDALVAEDGDLAGFVEQIVARAAWLLADPIDVLDLSHPLGRPARADRLDGLQGGSLAGIVAELPESIIPLAQKKKVVELWNTHR
ncbi:hypothetical protein [Chitinimonas lacunae]|uniref:Uncharacterized protein n=1 Tax=Chitinimonas lacunae TaxID=1963018 RepID=A0ABV8MPK4_9NEIS